MSRHAAATSAGRARTVQRTAPPPPRRVSGPVAPNRRDAAGSGRDRPPEQRAPGVRGGRPARVERAGARPGSRAPRARIDASALAYADAAIAAPTAFTAQRRSAVPRAFAGPRPQRLAYGGVAIASRVAGVAIDVSASRLMDRLVRGRVWIGVVAFCLIGLVATQVSLLKLNSGIGRAVQTASTLERSNASLRAEISRLSAGDRIQRLAAAQNMVMPAPSDVRYLRADVQRGDATRAAQRMHAADPNVAPGPAGAATQAAVPVAATAPATAAGQVAPAPAPAPTSATPPATTTPGATAPATSAPAASAPAVAGAATQTGAPSGGAAPQAATPIP